MVREVIKGLESIVNGARTIAIAVVGSGVVVDVLDGICNRDEREGRDEALVRRARNLANAARVLAGGVS